LAVLGEGCRGVLDRKVKGAFLLLTAAVSANLQPCTCDLEIEAALALRFQPAKTFLKKSMIFPQRRH